MYDCTNQKIREEIQMEADIKLRASKIEKFFPGVKALDKIDFTVRRGTVHALCVKTGQGSQR